MRFKFKLPYEILHIIYKAKIWPKYTLKMAWSWPPFQHGNRWRIRNMHICIQICTLYTWYEHAIHETCRPWQAKDQQMCTYYCQRWLIVGYETGVLWNMGHCGIVNLIATSAFLAAEESLMTIVPVTNTDLNPSMDRWFHYKMCDDISYLFPNFNGATVGMEK